MLLKNLIQIIPLAEIERGYSHKIHLSELCIAQYACSVAAMVLEYSTIDGFIKGRSI